MLKSWQGPTQSSGNASSGQFSYDASGRLTADVEKLDRPWRASDGTMPGNRVYSTGIRAKTYDAENRLRSQQTSSATGATYPLWGENNPGAYFDDVGQGSLFELQAIDYGADSHPERFSATYPPGSGLPQAPQTLIWLWDGNDVLAQCGYDNTKTQCSSYGFPVEGLGVYYPSNGYVVVQDRGLSGQIVASHDGVGFAGMKTVGRNARNYFFGGMNASAAPGSVSPDDGSSPSGNATVTGTKVAQDGWTLDNNTWQGVRTYDASVGQWNTPDAYAGDVHDPMSQKPFMWNRNNPYDYGDPSGFDALVMIDPRSVAPIGHMSMVIYDPKTMAGKRYESGPEHVGGVIGQKEVITIENIADVRNLGAYGQDTYHFGTTAAQDKAMTKFWTETKIAADAGADKYNAFDNSCADKVAGSLQAGGQDISAFLGVVPTIIGIRLQLEGYRVNPSTLKPVNQEK